MAILVFFSPKNESVSITLGENIHSVSPAFPRTRNRLRKTKNTIILISWFAGRGIKAPKAERPLQLESQTGRGGDERQGRDLAQVRLCFLARVSHCLAGQLWVRHITCLDLSLHTYVMKKLDRWFQSPFKLLQFVSSPVKGSLLFPAYVTS